MDHSIQNTLSSLGAFIPEAYLIAIAILILMVSAFMSQPRRLVTTLGVISLIGYAGLTCHAFSLERGSNYFSNMIQLDDFSLFFKLFFSVVSLVTLLFMNQSTPRKEEGYCEWVAFLLVLTVGMSMMAASSDLLMTYLALEFVSILSYVVVGFQKHNRASSEAGLKYVLYGGVSSGVMVFGLSYLFGLTGSTSYQDIAHYFSNLAGISQAPVLFFSLLCIFFGFGFKVATFPTQMWCPDVYEGAPTPVTAFLSVGPKAAGFAMALRFFYVLFDLHRGQSVEILSFINWSLVLALISAITMTLGNLAALSQRNVKRMMAYSSIAHAGYLMMGFSAFSQEGVEAVLFYLVVYLFMNLGAFLVILTIESELGSSEIEAFRGLGYRSTWISILLAIFLVSLTGLPPVAGFIGKLYLFSAVIRAGIQMKGMGPNTMYFLAFIAAVNTVIALFYYARLLRKMFLETPLDLAPIAVPRIYRTLSIVLVIPVVLLGIYWSPLATLAKLSAASLF